MNGLEERQMRQGIFEKEKNAELEYVRQTQGIFKYAIACVLHRIESVQDEYKTIREFNNLDELSRYSTLEEMAELLEEQFDFAERAYQGHSVPYIFYSIDSSFFIRANKVISPLWTKPW